MQLSSATKFVIAIGIVISLMLPGALILPRSPTGSTNKETPIVLPPAEIPSQPLANQAKWEEFTGQGGEWNAGINQSLFTRNVTMEELRVLVGEEALRALNGSASGGTPPTLDGEGTVEYRAGALDQSKATSGTVAREVEEADIVKLQGNLLYVLNSYRGLIIVDLSDKDRPSVLGALRLQGYPQDMYVVGNLSFVILSASYGYWYNYYTLNVLDCLPRPISGGLEVTVGTHIAVINLKNKEAPRVVMNIPLPGFASDSRRVGDVVYAVTNSYAWTGYGSDNGGTYVTSVDFSEPASVRRVDTLFFNGTSNQVHASPTAFYIAQPDHDYSGERGGIYPYSTKVTYIDISDPRGEIEARDSFEVAGLLSDKYQMDQYGSTFRIVTHFWGSSGQLGSSTLSIFDISDPDNIHQMGVLDINDAGTLMATRFAGDRAYTIHLPQSIDPLDVLDLSDPSHPRLTDILEMPGWVTHIEVRGYKLLALGVDNSGGTTNVAVSLFDVTDPSNAILKDRVRIGSGYTYSMANWEPKALTVVDEQGLVIVPFVSYSADSRGGSVQGIQLVEFDMAAGKLAAKGMISNTEPVTRTRALGDRVLATSDYGLQVIDANDRSSPRVIAKLQFVWNIQDAIRMGDVEVQLFNEGWEGVTGIRVVRSGGNEWDRPLSQIALDLSQVSLFPDGKMLYVMGVKGDELKLLAYDMADPVSPKATGMAVRTLPVDAYQMVEGTPGGDEKGTVPQVYYYSSLSTVLLYGKLLAVITDSNSYDSDRTICLFDLSSPGQPRAFPDYTMKLTAPSSSEHTSYIYYYATGFIGAGRTLYFTGWNGHSSYLGRIDLSDPRTPVRLADAQIKGHLVGAEPDGSAVYTTAYAYIYLETGAAGSSAYMFNVYKPVGQGLELAYSIEVNESISSARIVGGKAYLTLTQYSYYYGYDIVPGGYSEGDKSGAASYTPPRTTLYVIDLKGATGPALVGKMGLDGYASIIEVDGATVYLSAEGVLAAYRFTDGSVQFAGALAMRGYVQHLRPFDGGALISEGLYGTETLVC